MKVRKSGNGLRWMALSLAFVFLAPLSRAGESKDAPKKPKFISMDYGPFLAASIMSWPTASFDAGNGNFTGDVTARGIAIKLAGEWNAGVVFDADAVRMSAGWIGGPMKLKGVIFDGDHGPGPTLGVPPLFQTPYGPGWGDKNGALADPRADSISPLPRPGPLPAEWAKYKGLYRHGQQAILSYTVGRCEVLESPSLESADDLKAIARTFQVGASEVPLTLVLVDGNPEIPVPKPPKNPKAGTPPPVPATPARPDPAKDSVNGLEASIAGVHVGLVNAPAGAALEINSQRQLVMKISKQAAPAAFKVLIAGGGDATKEKFAALLKASPKPADLAALTQGGPALWPQVLETKGVLAEDEAVATAKSTQASAQEAAAKAKSAKAAADEAVEKAKAAPPAQKDSATKESAAKAKAAQEAEKDAAAKARSALGAETALKYPPAYVADRITVPHENPWGAWMRVAAFDFFSDGTRAAACTWSGDVWIVSGIDEKLESLKWKRFAAGLHQPLGLKIVDDKIYTLGHDQITRFHDLNGDGEADFHECFNADWELTTAFHAFGFDLHTDPQGNFVFAFGSPVRNGGRGFQKITNHHGCVLKVSKDGGKLSVYATGFRAPNGLGCGPDGQITSGDNEGTWVPASPLHWIGENSFNGVCDSAHGRPTHQPRPLCFMPKNIDNSGGGQVWVSGDKWGPFKGDLLHMSYGQSTLYKVLKEEVNGQVQGGVVKFSVRFTSSAMRARFNPRDGQLYVMGLKGWQSNAARDGGFDRVRYSGRPVTMPTGIHFTAKGVTLEFTGKLDPAAAAQTDNYNVEVWNYKWCSDYGSEKYSTALDVNDPKAKGKSDPMPVESATLSPDGKSVFLAIPGMKPVMQMKLAFKLNAADGSPLTRGDDGKPVPTEIHGTIHNLGAEK